MKKSSVITSALISTLAIGVALGAVFTSKNVLSKVQADPETYTITFDETHNRFNESSDNLNSALSTVSARTRTNAYIDFCGKVRNTRPTFYALDGYWQQTNYVSDVDSCFSYLRNIDKLNGLNSIVVNYEPLDEEDDNYRVDVWHSYYFSDMEDTQSKYASCNTLASEIPFDFDGDVPCYFKLRFWNVKIVSVSVTYSCEESHPNFSKVDHYEMVTNLSQITSTDFYTIGGFYNNGTENEWYVSNTSFGKNIQALNAIEYDGVIPEKKDYYPYLKLKITKNSDRYIFQTTNLGSDNGYLKVNTDWALETTESIDNAINFSLTMNEDYTIRMQYPESGNAKKTTLYLNTNNSQAIFALYHVNNTSQPHIDPIYLFKFVPRQNINFTLNKSNLTGISTKYTTGNYGSFNTNSRSFEYYRAYGPKSDYAFRLIHKDYYYSDHGYPSSVYNTTPIYGMNQLDITYKASSGLKVGYSIDVGVESYKTLEGSSSYVTRSVSLDDVNFFKIMDNGSDAYVQSIVVHYDDSYNEYNTSKQTYSANRKGYSVYSGSYTPGVTTKTMYISETETKTYTYYTYAYVNANKGSLNLDAIALTDPIDVCNYFEAFGCAPANYGQTNFTTTFRDGVSVPSRDNVKALFGNKARCMSKYNRTDGYAVAVPFNSGSGFAYYEFDIDTDGTYTVTSRQVGRVVAWDYGFSCYSNFSDRLPVCVYTDDHYATFQEYNNMGGFSPRFDAERNLMGTKHTPLTTIA